MFKFLYPDVYVDSAYEIDFKKYYDKGFRALVLDVDNTLVEHDAPVNDDAVKFFNDVRAIGFKTCIISNNSKERVEPFAKEVDSIFVSKAGKPKKKGFSEAMNLLGVTKENTLFIGDQIFTDVWGAKRSGIYCIMVKYIKIEDKPFLLFKRLLEKPVMFFYGGSH